MGELLLALREQAGPDLAALVPADGGESVTLAKLLTTGPGISGVIDINPPALTGDRAFDLAPWMQGETLDPSLYSDGRRNLALGH